VAVTQTEYDLAGNPTATIDPVGNRQETDYKRIGDRQNA
jgi:YD repeat-containing protein